MLNLLSSEDPLNAAGDVAHAMGTQAIALGPLLMNGCCGEKSWFNPDGAGCGSDPIGGSGFVRNTGVVWTPICGRAHHPPGRPVTRGAAGLARNLDDRLLRIAGDGERFEGLFAAVALARCLPIRKPAKQRAFALVRLCQGGQGIGLAQGHGKKRMAGRARGFLPFAEGSQYPGSGRRDRLRQDHARNALLAENRGSRSARGSIPIEDTRAAVVCVMRGTRSCFGTKPWH